MKKPLRHFILNVFSIALLSHLLTGVSYQNDFKILLIASLILSLINLFIKPILKIILLPINIITFGLAGWLIQIITLYLTTLLVEGFSISQFSIGPISLLGLQIPMFTFTGFWAYLGAALFLSIITNFVYWVL